MFHTRLHVPIPARKSPVPCSPPFTQHAASPHTPRCIGLRSTEHRLTLHVASPHAPRCINPPYSEPIFLPYEMPFPSCMLRCHRNLPALFVRFPPVARSSSAFRLLPVLLPALLPVFPRPFLRFPVPYVAIPSQPARAFRLFPPAARSSSSSRLFPPASRSARASSSSPPAWPQYRKSPPGLLSEGF